MDPHALSEGGYFARLTVALVLGVAIGLEREWRQRMAGLHTTAMVAVGAAIFAMIAPMMEGTKGDPTRIAAQVVSGIGFLAGGVILRQGANVRGLTTAATLWATAAVGVLAGFGFLPQAAGAAAVIVIANIVLYWLALRVDTIKRSTADVVTTYTLEIACEAATEPEVRSLVLDIAVKAQFSLASLQSTPLGEKGVLLRVQLSCQGRDDRSIEQLVTSIEVLHGVASTQWQASETFL